MKTVAYLLGILAALYIGYVAGGSHHKSTAQTPSVAAVVSPESVKPATIATPDPTVESPAAPDSDGEFRIVQVIPGGALVGGNYKDPATGYYQTIHPMAMLSGVKDRVEGDAFNADVKVVGSYSFTDNTGASRTVRKFELVKITRSSIGPQ